MKTLDSSNKYTNIKNNVITKDPFQANCITLQIVGDERIQKELWERKESFNEFLVNPKVRLNPSPATPIDTINRIIGEKYFIDHNINNVLKKITNKKINIEDLRSGKKHASISSIDLQEDVRAIWCKFTKEGNIILYSKENNNDNYKFASKIEDVKNLTDSITGSLRNFKSEKSLGEYVSLVFIKGKREFFYDLTKLIIAIHDKKITIDDIKKEWNDFLKDKEIREEIVEIVKKPSKKKESIVSDVNGSPIFFDDQDNSNNASSPIADNESNESKESKELKNPKELKKEHDDSIDMLNSFIEGIAPPGKIREYKTLTNNALTAQHAYLSYQAKKSWNNGMDNAKKSWDNSLKLIKV